MVFLANLIIKPDNRLPARPIGIRCRSIKKEDAGRANALHPSCPMTKQNYGSPALLLKRLK
jgi:hypothetical protein